MKLWGYNGKIIGNVIGNDGNRMGSTQRFMKFFLGLLFSRSGVKQKETWIFQGQYKNKKRPYEARFCELHKVLISYFFLGSQTMPKFALWVGLQDAEFSQKHKRLFPLALRFFPTVTFHLDLGEFP